MADDRVYENTNSTTKTESKEISQLVIFEDSKELANPEIHGELDKEQIVMYEDAETTQRYVGLMKVTSVDDGNDYEMPFDKRNVDNCYEDVTSLKAKDNGEKQNVTINQPSCVDVAASRARKSKTNPVPPVPCPREKSKSSFAEIFDSTKERPKYFKRCAWITTERLVILNIIITIPLLLSFVISFVLMRADIGKLQADLHIWKLGSIDTNITKLDEKFEQLEYKSDIRMEEMSNMTEMLRNYQDELKYIKKAVAPKELSFEQSTLHRGIYMSSDNRTISTHKLMNSTTGSGTGFQNYNGVRGTIQLSNFDIIYFEASVYYTIIGYATPGSLVFEVGFSTEDTIDGYRYVGYQNESWSLHGISIYDSIKLGYRVNSSAVNYTKTLTSNSVGTSYQGLFGFYIHGPKGDIYVIDKKENKQLHTFEHVDFTKRLYPVFAVFHYYYTFNVTLTLKTGP